MSCNLTEEEKKKYFREATIDELKEVICKGINDCKNNLEIMCLMTGYIEISKRRLLDVKDLNDEEKEK